MTNDLYFNAFVAEVKAARWRGFAVKRRIIRLDKFVRAEIGRRWRVGEVLAEVSEGDVSWILHHDAEASVLADFAYCAVPLDSVPAAIMLNFYLTLHAPAGSARGLFVGPSYKLWEVRRSRDEVRRDCLAPRFETWRNLVTIDVAATGVRIAQEGVERAVPVFCAAEGVVHRSAGHRIPQAGELVRDPPAKRAKTRIPWTPNASDVGPLAAKATFLRWLVAQINADGFVRLAPQRFKSEPLKNWIGARGQDAKLKKSKLIRAIEYALPSRSVAIYDRRTEAGEQLAWPIIVRTLQEVASRFGITIIDRSTHAQDFSDVAIFVAIDAEALFVEDEIADTKPAAVASFLSPIQCFSQSIFTEDVHATLKVAESVFLVMLANVLIKQEVCDKQLLLHREWVSRSPTMDVGNYLFCERFVYGEDAVYVGLRVTNSGGLDFIETRTLAKLLAAAEQRGLTPIFKRKPRDPDLATWPTVIEVADTPVRALPLLSREEMTAHFSGVRMVAELNAYYAAGAERPGPGKVEKALALRQITRAAGLRPDDLPFVAGCCVDPTVRLHAATVWPAPFKLIREYMALYGNHPTAKQGRA